MAFWTGRPVLVTGGAGFIGSHLVEDLVAAGARVTVADNLERGRLENLREVEKNLRFVQADLRDPEACRRVCAGQEIVLNLAAKVAGIEYNREHPSEMFEANLLLQQHVLRAAAGAGVGRFLQVSTACVYPHDALVPTPESEGHRGEPEPTNSGYGWAKRMGELLAAWQARDRGMEVAIVRPFNAYGPRDDYDPRTSHVLPALVKKIMDRENPVRVWGSGNQTRVFVHARDFARGILLVAERYAKADPVNVGHDEEISIRALVALVQRLTGSRSEVLYDVTKPEGHARRAADVTKLREVTGGFVPRVSLEDGVREMIAGYEGHRPAAVP
ncbi:MAG: SDR family NAD(P)-dependent oxidoreductase [Planctomycetes bacterium]|nr:SDR family NAD(P)-dependent oxidoreductase [Planctomycetota bacterium]